MKTLLKVKADNDFFMHGTPIRADLSFCLQSEEK